MHTTIVNLPRDQNKAESVIRYLEKRYEPKKRYELEKRIYEAFRNSENINDADSYETIEAENNNTSWGMFLSLVVGIEGAAFYLAMSFIEGYGTIKNEFLSYLTLSIGQKLGDPQVIQLLKGEPAIEQDIQQAADQCVAKINRNAQEIAGRDISYENWVGYGKDFDNLVKKFGHSYCDNILSSAMKVCSDYVEVDYSSGSGVRVAGEAPHNSDSCCAIL